jgi:hypothetical protein
MIVAALISAALVVVGLRFLGAANAGIELTRAHVGPTPVTVYQPSIDAPPGGAPVVVIAHGFAGSQQLMTPFAVSLARDGYLAVTFDFYGHGRNLRPLGGDVTRVEGATRNLVEQTGDVVDYALALPAAGEGLAVLGHSMASDVVIRYALADPRVEATVAVSMFSPAVTATAPRNLLMITGGYEGFLRREALRAVGMTTDDPQEGVTSGSFADGSARRAAVVAGVEHVGVLYSAASMREAVDWLNGVFERDRQITEVDRRGGAIVLLLLGLVLLGWPLSGLLPTVANPPRGASPGWRVLLPAGLIPAIATPLLLWWFPPDFLSVLVGGYLAVHFGLYGLLTACTVWWLRRRRPIPAPSDESRPGTMANETSRTGPEGGVVSDGGLEPEPAGLARGLVATVLATAYVAGVMALAIDSYVTSFAVTTPRLPLMMAMLAGTLCYFLADEWLTRGVGAPRGARVYTRACFLLSLGLAVALSFEDLFFLLIIAAIILVYFLIYGLFSGWIYRATGHPAVGAIANAVAFAWALAVVFPMLSGT